MSGYLIHILKGRVSELNCGGVGIYGVEGNRTWFYSFAGGIGSREVCIRAFHVRHKPGLDILILYF